MQEAAGVEYEVPWTQNPNAESIAKKRVLPVWMHTLRLGSGRDKPGAVWDSRLRLKGLRSRGFGFGVSPLALEFAIPTHIGSYCRLTNSLPSQKFLLSVEVLTLGPIPTRLKLFELLVMIRIHIARAAPIPSQILTS